MSSVADQNKKITKEFFEALYNGEKTSKSIESDAKLTENLCSVSSSVSRRLSYLSLAIIGIILLITYYMLSS